VSSVTGANPGLESDVGGPPGPEPEGPPLLEAVGVTKRFGTVAALENVSFAARKAEIVGLLGDNGAGKSTLVHILSGVVQPDHGEFRWLGKPVQLTSRHASAELGIETIFQNSGLVDSMSITRNIFMGREIGGPFGFMRLGEMREIAAEVLKTIVAIEGIDSPDKLVGQLSGGQKQAVAIARAVHFKRTLLILDEPTSALAVRATEALFEYLRTVRSQGVSSILVTHNLFDAYRICDHFVVMAHGRAVMRAARQETSVDELVEVVSRGRLHWEAAEQRVSADAQGS
jgi:simple sugar transport system ATP-binding protein